MVDKCPGKKTVKCDSKPTKRYLNTPKTLDRYEIRIRKLDKSAFVELSNSFLSTFDCYSNILRDFPNSHHMCNTAVVLMRIAREHGFNIYGVTSERRVNGVICVNLPDSYIRKNTKIIYVGKYNYFTQNQSSKWRLLPVDKVYNMVLI